MLAQQKLAYRRPRDFVENITVKRKPRGEPCPEPERKSDENGAIEGDELYALCGEVFSLP